MEKLYKQIGDEIIEYTAEDHAQREIDLAELEKIAADEVATKEAAKAAADAALAKLAALGLTADDLKALGL